MYIAIALILAVALIAAWLAWDARRTTRRHLAFGRDEVLEALDNVLSEDTVLHDKWDMFLARPIADPYLESLRQRCLDICRVDNPEGPTDLSVPGAAEVDAIRRELREAPDRSLHPTGSDRLNPGS